MTLMVQRSRGLLNIGGVFHTYFTKVIIVLGVTSLAAVVTGAGFRPEARVDWTL